MTTLTELRRELRKIGFRIQTEQMSHGRHATYVNSAGEKLSFNVGDAKSWESWKPLLAFLDDNEHAVKAVARNEKVYGLLKTILVKDKGSGVNP